jgi:hypothetical protein
MCSYNYAENCWTTSSLARSSYADQGVFDLPYATDYNSTATPNFPIQGITANMEHQLIMLKKPAPIKSIHQAPHLLMLLLNLETLTYLQQEILLVNQQEWLTLEVMENSLCL